MSTQTGGGTPHTCKAVEHCHTLNERVADLEGWLRLVDGATQAVSARVTELDESATRWHNTLARELRAHDAQLAALVGHVGWLRQAVGHPDDDGRRAVVHCSTCTCGQTFKLSYEAVAPTAPACGGCAGQGAHKRWCPEVVGEKAARLGTLAEEAESVGDRIGANDPTAANWCYNAAAHLTGRARRARVER